MSNYSKIGWARSSIADLLGLPFPFWSGLCPLLLAGDTNTSEVKQNLRFVSPSFQRAVRVEIWSAESYHSLLFAIEG